MSEHTPPQAPPVEEQPERPPSSLLMNRVSLVGLFLFATGFGVGLVTFMMDLFAGGTSGYVGLLYLLYLLIMLVGVVIAPLGMLRERRRRRRGSGPSMSHAFHLDMSQRGQRNIALIAGGGAILIMVGVSVGSYKTYQATESNAFCGQMCHQVMNPEYTAYQYSSHARVKCVECHIGEGADWWVRSKISGIRQIFAAALGTYPRPIPTPIHDLRPARETCEECHWPQKFIGFKEVVRNYVLSDEQNSVHRLRMMMKIGGDENSLMKGAGIHYHMLLKGKVEYRARNGNRQDIAWVRVNHGDGRSTVYEDKDQPLTESELETLEVRAMDCMDCHNRPSHKFPTPMAIVNQAIDVGAISRELPQVKLAAVNALDGGYTTTPEALTGIESSVVAFYEENYPEVLETKAPEVSKAVHELRKIFQRTIFPEMGASWAAYPDNIGHRDWPGCFRCHNDRLQSVMGNTIFTTCNKCHLIIAQGRDVDTLIVDMREGLEFEHPADADAGIKEYTDCTECHSGGKLVYE